MFKEFGIQVLPEASDKNTFHPYESRRAALSAVEASSAPLDVNLVICRWICLHLIHIMP